MNTAHTRDNRISPKIASGVVCGAAVILLAFMLAFAKMHANSSGSAQVRGQVPTYDGVTLYRALFFGSGQLATQIPTLRKITPYYPAEYKSLEGKAIDYIKAKDPSFFDSFARDIQSGDRVKVGQALKRANIVQKDAILDLTRNYQTPFASDMRRMRAEPEPSPSPEPFVQVVWIVCLYVPIVVSAASVRLPIADTKGLTFERYVDEIVQSVPRSRLPVREARP